MKHAKQPKHVNMQELSEREILEALTVEHEIAKELVPLWVRRIFYIIAIVALVAAPTVAIANPELSSAIVVGANILGAVGLGTALAHPKSNGSGSSGA